MNPPKIFEAGLNSLMEEYPSAEAIAVVIPNTTCKFAYQFVRTAIEIIGNGGIIFRGIYEYIPPPELTRLTPRTESIPDIVNSGLPVIVIDDLVETGFTLEYALHMLQSQGFSDDHIWAYIGLFRAPAHRDNTFGYLDRIQNVLKYRDEYIEF